ncbi:pilus assembly protein PilZ [Afipia sp. Root123D2]|jgi:hypothetical protein|nr:pilus assembly protein PilZ [Afipia sp. Root123D2]
MTAMIERRAEPRRRVLKSGTIAFSGQTVDCTIRNLSTRGAALDVATPMMLPASFKLAIAAEQVTRPCHLIWHHNQRIGIAFD